MSVLRRSYIEVEPTLDNFDNKLTAELRRQDPGGKAGKQIGGQLNRALKRLDLEAIDVKADPRSALAAIAATEERLQALSRDSATVEVKVRTEKALGELRRFKKQLGDVGGADAATGFFAKFSQRLGPLMASAPVSGPVAAGAGLLGAALAPSIAAGIGAGLAAGVGAAGIAGGIALVAKDPLVAAAGKDIGQRFAAGVTAEAQSFRTPVLGALKQIDAAASRTVPKIGQIFRNTVPSVDTLTGSLVRTGEALTDSLVTASSRSAGPLKALGALVEGVGGEFANMISTLSRDAPAGTSAINDLTSAMTNMIRTTTGIVHGLAVVKSGFDSTDNGIDSARYALEDFLSIDKIAGAQFDITADGYFRGSEAAELYRKGVIGVNGSLNDYSHYQKQGAAATQQASAATHQFIMDTFKADPPTKALVISLNNAQKAALGERSALAGLSNQLRAQTDPAFALIQAQNTLKTAQDKAAAATKQHGRNSVEARAATRDLASAAIDLQGKVGALGSSFNGRLTPQMIASFRAAGLTERQIRGVAREFVDAKKKGDAYSKRYSADARLTGGPAVSTKLKILGEMQAALASGNKPASYYGSLNKALLNVGGPQINRAGGGPISGPGTDTSDSILARLSNNEYVVQAKSAKKLGPQKLDYLNKYGELPAFAGGGQVWPYRVTASQTRIPSVKEVLAKVMPVFGNWPSSPSAQRGDSGVWRRIIAMVRAAGFSSPAVSTYRAGDPKWHGSGRAVDFGGFNQDGLAQFAAARRPLELIHRTNRRDYAYTRGVNKGSFNNSLMEAHRNHVHIAMDDGGYRMLQPGLNTIVNGTGRPEPIAGPAAMAAMSGNTYHINVSVPVGAHPAETGRQVVQQIQAFEKANGRRWRE